MHRDITPFYIKPARPYQGCRFRISGSNPCRPCLYLTWNSIVVAASSATTAEFTIRAVRLPDTFFFRSKKAFFLFFRARKKRRFFGLNSKFCTAQNRFNPQKHTHPITVRWLRFGLRRFRFSLRTFCWVLIYTFFVFVCLTRRAVACRRLGHAWWLYGLNSNLYLLNKAKSWPFYWLLKRVEQIVNPCAQRGFSKVFFLKC